MEGLKYTLEKNGFVVDNARTAKEAYQFFQAGRYDLLLLDVTLDSFRQKSDHSR